MYLEIGEVYSAAPLDVEHYVAFPLGKSKVNGEKGLSRHRSRSR
jgi:hypothetical protein